jgi:5-methyltetrahydropteroyltriglutamate--homocysteine methyltransferase
VGVVNQKKPEVESGKTILERAERAVRLFGEENVLLTPDCGFATYAASARAVSCFSAL